MLWANGGLALGWNLASVVLPGGRAWGADEAAVDDGVGALEVLAVSLRSGRSGDHDAGTLPCAWSGARRRDEVSLTQLLNIRWAT
jgi:hypothetical protein